MGEKNAHCSYCGKGFGEAEPFPRTCKGCGSVTHQNPIPVAVVLVPIGDGLLTIRRGIAPHEGKLALPGGFIDAAESWQQAAARELREETGIEVDADGIKDFWVKSASDGTLLVFGESAALEHGSLAAFTRTDETTERVVVTQPVELAFPLHTEAVRRWFRARAGLSGPPSSQKR
jgi:ADP-ribose pyrophosphatase YjhB (NUDIX family)